MSLIYLKQERDRVKVYFGDHIRVRMNVTGNDEFIVKVRNREDRRPLQKVKKLKLDD